MSTPPDKPPGGTDPSKAGARDRRYATVLFSDVSGFTALSRKMDHEDVAELTNDLLDVMKAEVVRQQGYVVKRIGDCILAVFGAPQVLEDAPARAVNAAIEMHKRVRDFAKSHGVDLDIHTGVNTGEITAGQAEGIYDVWGDTVNLASRIEGQCPKGSIYVGAETYRYTRDDFEYKSAGMLDLKNVEKPIEAFEVLSRRERVYRRRALGSGPMRQSGLIGRGAELAELRRRIGELREGKGSIVLLLGEAGIGKSRLMAELLGSADVSDLPRLEARALAVGQTLAFHPFVDLFRRWAGIDEDDDEATALRKLESGIADLVSDDAGEVFPFVARLIGMTLRGAAAERVEGIEGEALERLILKSVRTVLLAAAARGPVLAVFEDLHWADESSVKLLQSLLRLVTEVPILFLLISRHGDQVQAARPVLDLCRTAFAPRLAEVVLEPLGRRDCNELVERLLQIDQLPPSARTLIYQRSGGNPFYLEEIVRSLMDVQAEKPFTSPADVEVAVQNIPGTIQEVIMVRVERLPEASRSLLRVAATIGGSVPPSLLRVVADRDEPSLEWDLRQLVHRGLLVKQTTQEGESYGFKHALMHDTVYNWTSKKLRNELHAKVASALESLFADRLSDYYGMLAYHYSRSSQLEKAEQYLFEAGTQAARAAAPAEAIQFFKEASRIYLLLHMDGGDPARLALLEKNIGLAFFARGSLLESIEHFTNALEHLGDVRPKSERGALIQVARDMIAILSHLYVRRPRPAPVSDTGREILEVRHSRARAQVTSEVKRFVFDTIGTIRRMNETDPRGISNACGMYAEAALLFSFLGMSTAVSRRILAIAEGLSTEGTPRDEFAYKSMRFLFNYLVGDWSPDWLIDDELIQKMLSYGNVWDVNTYVGLACERDIHRGDFAGVAKHRRLLEELERVYGYEFAQSNLLAYDAMLLLERRQDLPAAIERWQAYLTRDEPLLNLFGLSFRAETEVHAGDLAAARTTIEKAESIANRLGAMASPFYTSPMMASRLLYDVTLLERALLGKSSDVSTLRKKARATLKRSLRITRRIARERVEVVCLAGRLAWLLGKTRKAALLWAKSIDEATRLGARAGLARTYVEAGRRISRTGSSALTVKGLDAGALLERGRQLMLELGLDWDLEQAGLATPEVGAKRVA